MFVPSEQGASASTASGGSSEPLNSLPVPPEQVRHILLGSPGAVQRSIQLLYRLGYAEPNDWSRPLPTGRVNEVMAILTKRV